ncbi:MAG: pyridoxine 5'-phosphate synthase, partial [Mariprofundaceae bacterium]|nr:pyridoxine 5'-phosphate synthase [Mariprofundaceae bacterium]
ELHLNMEMAVTDEMVAIACRLKPQAVCLVPEKREELTTEGGLDVAGHESRMQKAVAKLSDAGCRVSMFIDPDQTQVDASHRIAAPVIELHTGHFANLSGDSQKQECSAVHKAAAYARGLGLMVHAGHGLTLENTPDMVAISDIEGLNIGHAIIADAVFKGLHQSVMDFKAVMQR